MQAASPASAPHSIHAPGRPPFSRLGRCHDCRAIRFCPELAARLILHPQLAGRANGGSWFVSQFSCPLADALEHPSSLVWVAGRNGSVAPSELASIVAVSVRILLGSNGSGAPNSAHINTRQLGLFHGLRRFDCFLFYLVFLRKMADETRSSIQDN
jgi:hypothetical protein